MFTRPDHDVIHFTMELLKNFLYYNYIKLLITFSVNSSKFINC